MQRKTERLPKKEKIGWGWGWLVLIVLIFIEMQRVMPQSSYLLIHEIISFIQVFVLLLILFLYRWVRKKLIQRRRYTKKWHASIVAGTISYITALFLVGIGSFGPTVMERNKNRSDLEKFLSACSEKLLIVNDEQRKFLESFIENPNKRSEIEHVYKGLIDLLSLHERKNAYSREFLEHMEKIIPKRNSREFSKKYNRLTLIVSNYYRKIKETILVLCEYYGSGDAKKFNEYKKLIDEVELVEKEARSLMDYIAKNL